MYKKELDHRERYFRDSGDELQVETSLTVYEVYIETRKDKDGNLFLNKDGTNRLFAIRDDDFLKLENDLLVKKINDTYFKIVYKVSDDYVEKVERDGRRVYYVVDPEKVQTLPAGTQYIPTKNDGIKVPNEIGYALVDDTVPDAIRVLAVRRFTMEDHVEEARQVLAECNYVHKERN